MIVGAHILLFSQKPELDRAFLRDVLGLRFVDIGHDWLIFALPPAEAAVHPADHEDHHADAGHAMIGAHFYLMCDDLKAYMKSLEAKKVTFAPVTQERWGIKTAIRLPSGGEIGLYQPTHPTALNLNSR